MHEITVLPGTDKHEEPERFDRIELRIGGLYTIVGNTGSGKTRFIKDIEQLVQGDSPTKRSVLVDGNAPRKEQRRSYSGSLIAHLSQNMRFVLDVSVDQFIELHRACRASSASAPEVLELANRITPERIDAACNLNLLSGGQTRALMIADIALVCNSPIVLVDEIENAGIDKEVAFEALLDARKLVLVVTHDPHTALLADTRIVMAGGAVSCVRNRTTAEEQLEIRLHQAYRQTKALQSVLRTGEALA